MREVTGIDATLGKRQGKREEMDEAERTSGRGEEKRGRCRKPWTPCHGSVSIDLPFWCETVDHEPFSVVLEEVKIFFFHSAPPLPPPCSSEVTENRSPFR